MAIRADATVFGHATDFETASDASWRYLRPNDDLVNPQWAPH